MSKTFHGVTDTPVNEIPALLAAANEAFASGVTLPLAWRKKQVGLSSSSHAFVDFLHVVSPLLRICAEHRLTTRLAGMLVRAWSLPHLFFNVHAAPRSDDHGPREL
jgi:hypothetical protein